jgi:uncharacterized protein with HEPN domain
MQPDPRDASYLWDMLEAAREIIGFTHGATFAEYSSNRMLHLAVERAVEIIGEARTESAPLSSRHIRKFRGGRSWIREMYWSMNMERWTTH